MIRTTCLIVAILVTAPAWSQSGAGSAIPDDEAGRCRYAVEHMIAIAQASLQEPTSRAERVEKRRKLVDDWSSRLEQGEDPCVVYTDIQKAATTF